MKIIFLAITVLLSQCVGGTPEYKAARQFIDAYYVMADQKSALEMVSDVAKSKIEKEIELLEGVGSRQDSYKSRPVEFKMLKEVDAESETNFLFEITLHVANSESQKKNVAIVVNKQNHKIKFFGEL